MHLVQPAVVCSLIVSKDPQCSELRELVLKRGGLHMEMSFLGFISHLMAGSGLKELLGVIYAIAYVSPLPRTDALDRSHGDTSGTNGPDN